METIIYRKMIMMSFIHKIAVTCAIIGCIWIMLLSVAGLLSAFIDSRHPNIPTADVVIQNGDVPTRVFINSINPQIMGIVIHTLTTFFSILAFGAILSLKRRPRLMRFFIWVSTITALIISVLGLLTVFSSGFILFLPGAILLLPSAIGPVEKDTRYNTVI